MSEEKNPQENPQEESKEEGNKIFDALYNAAAEEQTEEQEEEFQPPSSLQSALHDIEQEPEQPVQETGQEEAKPEEKNEEKPKPKQKSRVKRKIVDPEFKRPERPKEQASSPVKEDPFIKDLLPEERDRYEIAKWASQNIEDQKSLATDYLNFFKRNKSFLQKNREEFGDDILRSDEYRNFLGKFKPKADIRKLEREMLTAQAEKRALDKIAPHFQQMQREQLRTRGAPRAKEVTMEALKDLTKTIPESFRDSIVKDAKSFAENNPLQAEIIQKGLRSSKTMIEEFNKIVHDVVDYDEKNPLHAKISDFITKEQDKFINSGRTVKGGKTFIRRERMPMVPKDQKDKYYTFTDSDIIKLIKMRSGQAMESQANQIQKLLERSGYVRANQPAPQPQPQPFTPQSPRIQAPTQRAGVTAPASQEKQESNPILKLLDL